MRVLVTDGEERASLAVVRSLGKKGYRAEVTSTSGRSLAGASRFATREHRVPKLQKDPEKYALELVRIVSGASTDVLIPVTEASLHALLPRRSALGDSVLPFPEHDVFDAVCDKARVHEVAAELGIPVPRQVSVADPEEASEAGDRIGFPVVVKPSRSLVPSNGTTVKTSVRHASDRSELREAVREIPRSAYPVLIQDRIEGPGTGVFLLLWEGELLASFCHRRIREKPPSGGVSVLRESVALDPELLELSLALLERFGWRRGVAMVEYKRDQKTGRAYLMEINGRFWGSLQLAVDAGVDFPSLLVEAATGRNPDPVSEYREGVRTRWLLGDIDHLLARLRRSPEDLGLQEDAPGRGEVVKSFLAAFGPSSRNEVFRWTDPRPSLRETVDWIRETSLERLASDNDHGTRIASAR